MPRTRKPESGTRRVSIEGEMTIYRVAELKQFLLDAMKGADLLQVDLSAVSELDAAGVQLLMMATQAARAAGTGLRLVDHSPAVLEVMELLDLAAFFGAPPVSGAGSPA